MEMAPKKWLLMPEPGRKVKCWARVELLRVYLPCCAIPFRAPASVRKMTLVDHQSALQRAVKD